MYNKTRLLWSEYLCPPKIHLLGSYTSVSGIRSWGLGKCVGPKGGALMEGLVTF